MITRMKPYVLFLIIITCGVQLKTENVRPLPEIMNPNIIAVNENKLYISDQYSIIVYSLDDFSVLHRLGGKGDGPQEFRYLPFLFFPDGKLWVKDGNRIITFSKEMKLIKEMRVPIFMMQICPFGDNYLLSHNDYEKNSQIPAISIFDKEFNKVKTICRGEKTVFERRREKEPIVLVGPILKFQCGGDKAYIADGRKGFHIEIYDLAGNKIKEIKKSIERVKTGESQKRNRINEAMRARAAIRNWDRIKNNIQFPEYLPLMRDIHTADKKLFIKTWGIKDGREEYVVFDLDGKEITTVYLPTAMMYYYSIYNHTFYYVTENEEMEEWELHWEKITF
jgi:hypothetical protein